jgi:TM2 domain-containing membrane protein YozV
MKSNYTQKLGLAFALVALFLASCGSNATFSKRYHNRGFNIAWGGGADASPSKPAPKKVKSAQQAQAANGSAETKVAVSTETAQSNFTAPLSPVTGAASADIATVPNHIIYVQPVAHAAKTTQIAKTTLTSISHRNADAKVMTQSKAVLKKQKKAAASGPGKSQIVALILCILVGVLGIHRFYLGYPLEGVLMLLTGGGCGIWWIIDLIRIVTGDLQPFDGEYTETL